MEKLALPISLSHLLFLESLAEGKTNLIRISLNHDIPVGGYLLMTLEIHKSSDFQG